MPARAAGAIPGMSGSRWAPSNGRVQVMSSPIRVRNSNPAGSSYPTLRNLHPPARYQEAGTPAAVPQADNQFSERDFARQERLFRREEGR